MAKKKLKTTKRINRRMVFIGLAIALIGSIAIYANAATQVSEMLRRSNNLAIGYAQNKPSVTTKTASGEEVIESRPRAIDVSKKGEIFCTPENQGAVTRRTLSTEEKQLIANDIYSKAPVNQPSVSTQPKLNEKTMYVDTVIPNDEADTFTESQHGDYINQSLAILERLCAVPGQPITNEEIEKLSVKTLKGQRERQEDETISLFSNSKVEAGGTTPLKDSAPDTAFENIQHTRLAGARQAAGKRTTFRTGCLDNAAREWAREMARTTWMRHSNPMKALPERHCGTAWRAIAENVGWSGPFDKPWDKPETSHWVSNTVFDAYMASPGHKANILNSAFNKHGVGAWKSSDGRRIYTATMFWAD